jgi:hypothetical protein
MQGCGIKIWPTLPYLSNLPHDLLVLTNLARGDRCLEISIGGRDHLDIDLDGTRIAKKSNLSPRFSLDFELTARAGGSIRVLSLRA